MASRVLAENPAAITVHARTRNEMSKVPARWEHVAEAVRFGIRCRVVRQSKRLSLAMAMWPISSMHDARVEKQGATGRCSDARSSATLGFFANRTKQAKKQSELFMSSIRERLIVMVEHTKLFEKLLGDVKNFAIMKKHYKAYANNFDGAVALRAELMECTNSGEVEAKVGVFLTNLA